MRQVSCARRHATLALNTAFSLLVPLAFGAASVSLRRRFPVAYGEMSPASVERAFVSAGSSGQRE